MTTDRWTRIERIYHAALEHSPRDRAAFVRREAHGDDELVAEIEALLAYDDRPAAFMQQSAMELAARALATRTKQDEPERYSGTLGSYEIVHRLGTGGMGDVYLAHDRRLSRKVALKVLRPDLDHPDRTAALREEALAASALNHPNILTIYEVGAHEGARFIAAEYVDGVTLRERLKQGAIPASELIAIALQIAEGLAAAHDAGVVHRDVKPENVMLRPDGLVKILDFGIATRTGADLHPAGLGSTGPEGAVIGTTGYMSPEQRQGLPVDPRTDVWSLGVVIFEMATGHLPTPVTHASSEGTPRNGESYEPDRLARLPRALVRIVALALSHDRDDRYATAKELAGDLRDLRRRLEDGSSDTAAAEGPTADHRAGRARTMSRRAASLILVLATAYFAAVAGRSREKPAITSIGVMPLEHAGKIRDGEYLADGIAASLRSGLARFSSIRQGAASEAARYQRLGVSTAQAGREMQADAVLTGTVDRRADSVVVRLELLRSADGTGLWKRQFVRPIDDVLTLQTEIARELLDALGLSAASSLIGGEETRDPTAYQLYVKGRYHVLRRTPDDLRKGLEPMRCSRNASITRGATTSRSRISGKHSISTRPSG